MAFEEEFLSDEQIARYGRFPEELSAAEPAAAVTDAFDVAGLLQLGHDALDGPLGDADLGGDVARADSGASAMIRDV